MPTLNIHTHCQAAPANAQSQAWQRVCLFQRTTKTTDKPTDEKNTEPVTAVLRNGGCSGKLKVSFSNQFLWWVDSLVLRIPPLRKAAKR
jgi:hypothetical protein